jgi:hypothetical protein
MFNQTIKSNINKIDYDLKELFSNVTINERTHFNKYFFEIKSEGIFQNLLESNSHRMAKSLVIIEKKDLESDLISWKYSVNPTDNKSHFIERISNIENIAEDIYNTIAKKQMDIEYLQELPEVELEEEIVDVEGSFEEDIIEVVEKFDLLISDIRITRNISKNIIIQHEGIETSEMFKLESKLLKLERVNYVSFDNDLIKINYN